VLVHARNHDRAQPTVDEITAAGGSAEAAIADVASMAEVASLARTVGEKHRALHVLVNNAGYWSGPRETTREGFEKSWAVNALAPFALALRLREPLAAGGGCVINVASREHFAGRMNWEDLQHERGFSPRKAYRQAKLALVMQTVELARREPGLRANSVHPGVIATDLFRRMPWIVGACIGAFCPSADKGARTIWRLAVEEQVRDATGRFFYRFKEGRPHEMALDPAACGRLWDVLSTQAATTG
jgi:NAD(P)-dependent dehydrogenase (short-subunit alcohol dehydrogenase family)